VPSEEGLEFFNSKRIEQAKPPVYNIRTIEDGEKWVGESVGKAELRPKTHVEKGDNFFAIYRFNQQTNKRDIESLSFFDAVQTTLKGFNLVPELSDCTNLFTLSKNDLVYVPYDDEDINTINWQNKKLLFHRIYRVVKFSENEVYFRPHFAASEIIVLINDKKVGEFTAGQNGVMKIKGDTKSISQKCIKITMDKLGQSIKPILMGF
jgi:CRISPR-associated endonuclease Csn1